MSQKLTDEQWNEIRRQLEGTCQETHTVIENMGLDIDTAEVEDGLLDGPNPIERCAGCDWWIESALLEDNGYSGYCCEQCAPELFE